MFFGVLFIVGMIAGVTGALWICIDHWCDAKFLPKPSEDNARYVAEGMREVEAFLAPYTTPDEDDIKPVGTLGPAEGSHFVWCETCQLWNPSTLEHFTRHAKLPAPTRLSGRGQIRNS